MSVLHCTFCRGIMPIFTNFFRTNTGWGSILDRLIKIFSILMLGFVGFWGHGRYYTDKTFYFYYYHFKKNVYLAKLYGGNCLLCLSVATRLTTDRAKAVHLSSPLFLCMSCVYFKELMHGWWYECFVCVWVCFALEMGLCFVLRFLLELFLIYSLQFQ